MSKKSKVQSGPSKFAQPYIAQGANTLQGAYNQYAPPLAQASQEVGGLLPGVVQRAEQGNPAVAAGTGYATDVLSGKYLDQGNPYLQQMIDQTGNDVRNQVAGALGIHGLTGGSDFQKNIANQVARNALALRYQNYGQERGLQQQTLGNVPGLAASPSLEIAPALSLLGAYQAPLNAAYGYSGALGGLLGGYQTQSQNPSPLNALSGVGSLLTGIAAL